MWEGMDDHSQRDVKKLWVSVKKNCRTNRIVTWIWWFQGDVTSKDGSCDPSHFAFTNGVWLEK